MPQIEFTLSLNTSRSITKDVEQVIQNLQDENYLEVYELIPNDKPIAPYFDIDCKAEHPSFQEWYSNREELLEETIQNLRGIFGSDCEFAVSDSCQEGVKLSYHLKITNRQTTMGDMYNVSRKFKAPLDKAVYHSRMATKPRKFRTILSTKEETGRILKPVTHLDDLKQHFITVIDENAEVFKYKDLKTRPPIDEVQIQSGIGMELRQDDTIDYDDWFRIGISLRCVLGSEKGRLEFLNYSKRHSSYNENQFNTTWGNIVYYNYTNGGWGLLRKYLSPEQWNKYIPSNPPMNMTDMRVSDFFLGQFTAYKLRHTGEEFYKFENHRWTEVGENEVMKDLMEFLSTAYTSLISSCEDDEGKDKLIKMRNKVESMSFLKSLLTCVKVKVSDAGFLARLDQNPNLIGFDNGVLDLATKQFRDGNEYDYISYTTGYDYAEPDETKMEVLKKIIWTISSENQNKYDTLLKSLARAMCGDNTSTNQKFYCMYGKTASNGKSTLQNLISQAFGDYFHQCQTTFITQQSARSDSANGDLASMVGKRFLFMSETEKDTRFNVATIKNFSGEDKYTYRSLFQKKYKTSKITFTMFLLTNDKLSIDCDDFGILRRVVYFSMKSKFVDKEEDMVEDNGDGVKYYLKDPSLSCCELRNEFVHLLLEHYNHKEMIEFTGEIKQETEELINSQDELKEMLNLAFKRADNPQIGISWADFKNVMKERYGNEWLNIRRKHKTEDNLIDKIAMRIPYAKKVGVAQGRLQPYFTADGTAGQSRRIFMNVVEREEEGGRDVRGECVI